jgi:hypothetical protein
MSKKGFKKMQDVVFMGANTLQATQLLKGVNPVSTIPGFIGIGVAGATASAVSNFGYKKKKRRGKK